MLKLLQKAPKSTEFDQVKGDGRVDRTDKSTDMTGDCNKRDFEVQVPDDSNEQLLDTAPPTEEVDTVDSVVVDVVEDDNIKTANDHEDSAEEVVEAKDGADTTEKEAEEASTTEEIPPVVDAASAAEPAPVADILTDVDEVSTPSETAAAPTDADTLSDASETPSVDETPNNVPNNEE